MLQYHLTSKETDTEEGKGKRSEFIQIYKSDLYPFQQRCKIVRDEETQHLLGKANSSKVVYL